MIGWLVLALALYALWCTMLYLSQDRLIFPRHFAGSATPEMPYEPFIEQVWIEPGSGVRVEAWFVRAGGESDREGERRPLAVFFHGNGELIEHVLDIAAMYRRWGMHVLIPEYRGYGRSGGAPGQAAIVEDAAAFLEIALGRPDVDPDRVVLHGRSLGAAVACALSERREPAAMILTSAFTSVAAMARRYVVPSFLLKHPFRNDAVLRNFEGPVLIMHGAHDGIIPVAHGRRLHEIAPNSVYAEIDAGHNDFPPDWHWYTGEIRSFLDERGLLPAPPAPKATSGTARD